MDANPFQNEKLSIKNLLFTKAIPNYTLPIPTDGRPIYSCTDCGDKFIMKSSYEYHIKRKSLKITYFCRHCNFVKIFFNRCGLLSHIRSHAFKTATISISDLKIEPLPLSYYNYLSQSISETETPASLSCLMNQNDNEVDNENFVCFDCKRNMHSSGTLYKDRAKHYTQYINILYSCPICLLTLTTKCALEAHLRIHMKEPPYYCPDCGIFLTKKAIVYPYSHDCESFKMMRAATKLKCSVNNCNKIFHPSESIKHLRTKHLKSVYKCSTCSVACYKLDNMRKHLKSLHSWKSKHNDSRKVKHIDFMQCEMCPGRLVIPAQIEKHLKSHEDNYINIVYPCWTCGVNFTIAKSLLEHQEMKHPDIYTKKILGVFTQESNAANTGNQKTNTVQNISKRCDKCYKNVASQRRTNLICKCKDGSTSEIVCNLCQAMITQDWNLIKKHYSIYHKEHVCLDAKILVKKIRVKKNKKADKSSKKHHVNVNENLSCNIKKDYNAPENFNNISMSLDNNKFVCSKCGQYYENKQSLEKHIVEHRDPFMAYQCMECGESFIAKPSFSTHLLLKHEINDVNNYIDQKKCYSQESLYLQKPVNNEQNEPIKDNQCNICREQFSNSTDFEKHFRVHGMAFLKKNTNKPISPEKQ